MKTSTRSALAVVGAGAFVIVLGCVAVLGFLYLVGKRIYITNDTATDATVTFLMQNHDDGGAYLSEATHLTAGEDVKEDIGFESIRCVYISIEQQDYSTVFDYRDYGMNDETRQFDVNMSALLTSDSPCPVEKSEVSEGVRNRVQLRGGKL